MTLFPDHSYRDQILDNRQKSWSAVYMLADQLYSDDDSSGAKFRIYAEKHDQTSASWIRGKSLTDFVLETFPDAQDIHSSVVTEDRLFGFKINAICSVVAAHCRRGIGNNLYVGPGVKFGPKTQENIDIQSNGEGRDYWVQYVDWLPEGKVLNLYWNRRNCMDIPFMVAENGDILANRNCGRYGAIITVPESQRE